MGGAARGGSTEEPPDDLDFARIVHELVTAGYGSPGYIRRTMTRRQFLYYLDAARHRRHTADAYQWVLAGQDPMEFPDYESPVEGHELTNEEIERRLDASPYVRRAPEPSPES